MTRRSAWGALAVAGVLVAVGAPVGWAVSRPAETVGAATAEALAAATPTPAATPATPTPTRATLVTPGPAVPTQDGRVRAGTRQPPAPVAVELPSIGVRAAVHPVGVDRRGELGVPADVADVGWYRYGPRPGDPAGSTVLGGHVDSAEQGRGAFFRLRELGPGDPVLVRAADGRVTRYRVVAREEWPKSAVPLGRLFARTGAPRLTLVTCGGGFREDVGSYTDNIAVTAVPEAAG